MERVWVPEPWEPGTPGLLDERDMNDSCLRPLLRVSLSQQQNVKPNPQKRRRTRPGTRSSSSRFSTRPTHNHSPPPAASPHLGLPFHASQGDGQQHGDSDHADDADVISGVRDGGAVLLGEGNRPGCVLPSEQPTIPPDSSTWFHLTGESGCPLTGKYKLKHLLSTDPPKQLLQGPGQFAPEGNMHP